MKSNVIKAVLLLLCSIFFDGCVLVDFRDPEMPPSVNICCNGHLFTDPDSNTPIYDALIIPDYYFWVNSSYTGAVYHAYWTQVTRPARVFSESVQKKGTFLTDSVGAWGGTIDVNPTKLRLNVYYLGEDSVIHNFCTHEYDYKGESSWQHVTIYVSEYE